MTSVFFAKYVDCEDLCILRCLQCYIGRTSPSRPVLHPDIPSPLLVSYHGPHHPVKSCSISRWIKSVLESAGIDTSIFKGHSTRSASTSKARSRGVPLEEVAKMADWSGTSTFKRFYYRQHFIRRMLEPCCLYQLSGVLIGISCRCCFIGYFKLALLYRNLCV